MIRYCLDSGVFINSWTKHYPPEMFQCVWDHLHTLFSRRLVFIAEEVYNEVHKGGDGVTTWLKARKSMIMKPDEETVLTMSEIVHTHQKLTGLGGRRSGADPWVIAHAKQRGAIVVTEETASNNLSKPRIPDVCVAIGVECINTLELLRRTNFKIGAEGIEPSPRA